MTDVLINKTYSGYRTCYHIEEDCAVLSDSYRTITKEFAENRMGLELCGHCDGPDTTQPDMSLYRNAKDADLGELR